MNATEEQTRARPRVFSQGKDEYADSRRRGIPKGNGITFPRWLLFPAGFMFTLTGILGLINRRALDRAIPVSGRKTFSFLVFGSFLMWVGSTWQVRVRLKVTRLLGFGLLATSVQAVVTRKKGRGPWEALLYAFLGGAFLAAGYWKRPFDYRD